MIRKSEPLPTALSIIWSEMGTTTSLWWDNQQQLAARCVKRRHAYWRQSGATHRMRFTPRQARRIRHKENAAGFNGRMEKP